MRTRIYNWILANELLILICCGVILIRIPSWFEPYWYGDEAIYLTIGQAINRGIAMYKQIHDNKPPLLYVVSALSQGNLFWLKISATVSAVVTTTIFARLAKNITGNKKISVLATVAFAAGICWPKLEGNIANAELFFLLPTVGAVSLLTEKVLNHRRVLLAGGLIGIAALFKVPAALELAVWPFLWMATGEKKWFRYSLALGCGAAIPIVLSGIYFFLNNSLNEYIKAAWMQNIPYISSWKHGDSATGIYNLMNRLFVLGIIFFVVFGFNRRWGKNGTLISAWLGISLFAALLSGRPYPHYLLQVLPAAVLSVTMLFFDKPKGKPILAAMLGILGSAVFLFGFYNYRVFEYYKNFLLWASEHKTGEEYLEWFGPSNRTNYAVADRVRRMTQPEDQIFVWGDEPMIYALTERRPTGRYTVKYHIKEFSAESETMHMLAENPPAVVISYGQEDDLPGFEEWLENNYHPETTVGEVMIFSREKGDSL